MPFLPRNQQRQSTEGKFFFALQYNTIQYNKSIYNAHMDPTTLFFTGQMPFLPSNLQRQNTEGIVITV